jgi:hypothetical protein
MANFTRYLSELIDDGYDLGMQDYPIWDEAYREELNKKIIDHYYYHEIAFETDELFIWFLNVSLRENMPYFNNLYSSIVGIEDAFKNVDVETAQKSEAIGSTTGTGEQTQYAYPQTRKIEGEDYATGGADSTQTSSSENTSGGVSKTEGLQGLMKSQAAEAWRAQLFDIDMLVIRSLEQNFMEIWSFSDNVWL